MRISIRAKLTLILLAVVSCVLLLTFILNATLTRTYYTKMKERALKDSFNKITSMDFNDPSTSNKLESMEENESIQILILDDTSRIVFCSKESVSLFLPVDDDNSTESGQVWFKEWLMPRGAQESSVEIFQTQPALSQRYNTDLSVTYLSLYAKASMNIGGVMRQLYIIINTSTTAIEDAAKVSNSFLLIICVIMLFVGCIVMYFIGNSVVKPIVRVSNTAMRMSKLDFGSKLDYKSNDELGKLASSINHMSEQLESKILDLRYANHRLRQELLHKEQVDNMRRDFISDVSHELKTPLAIILGYCEGLQLNVNSEEREYYCNVIEDEAIRMNKLAARLLKLAELESGEIEPEMTVFDLGVMAKDKLGRLSYLLDERDIKYELSVDGESLVYGDPERLEEVFDNFLTNAKNHTPDGGEIKLSLCDADDSVECSIFNSGSHIPEDSLEKIWQSFYKVDKARTRSYGGSGLGLRIVSTILDAHGAKFGAENTENGVRFYFILKKATEQQKRDAFDFDDNNNDSEEEN